MLLSRSVVFDSIKIRIRQKKQAAFRLLNQKGIRTPFAWFHYFIFTFITMNNITNKFLLAGDKFKHEMHLRQPGFMYCAFRSFEKKKNKQEYKQLCKATGDSRNIYRNKLDKACFQHDMAYEDFNDSPRRITSDKIFRNKAFKITSNLKYEGYQRGLASTV